MQERLTMTGQRTLRWLGIAILPAIACAEGPTLIACPSDLRVALAPREITLIAGENASAGIEVKGCAGTRPLEDVFSWSSRDPFVADVAIVGATRSVGTSVGHVTGRNRGTTIIDVSGERYHQLGQIKVTVASARVGLGEDIVLVPGRLVVIEHSDTRFSFDGVTSDSRCPRDVQCVSAGNATPRLRVSIQGDSDRVVELNTAFEPTDARVGSYLLRLTALTPDPVPTRAITQSEYRLRVRLERLQFSQ